MPPKRTSTSETPAITLAAIQQLIANGIATALEAQAATMAMLVILTGNTGTYCLLLARDEENNSDFLYLIPEELAVLCPNMVPNTEKLMEIFISGLPRSIEGNVTALKP
ncbi:hypothetical protein Tco_0491721 [Tanacetum coccineum]